MLPEALVTENYAAGGALTELKFQRPSIAFGTFRTTLDTDKLVGAAAPR